MLRSQLRLPGRLVLRQRLRLQEALLLAEPVRQAQVLQVELLRSQLLCC
ncbi:hypothetical protein PLANPX_0232 [Lacipirellula parvula]|uniref:Uncharacterized protein n=1 Tax=Lacipirellula parvula TaxID=2650471 RepID=A0A5K7X2B9_9BACT|nr:hypothetical protein PLANPX_0232 [Lacipirellula parvula]